MDSVPSMNFLSWPYGRWKLVQRSKEIENIIVPILKSGAKRTQEVDFSVRVMVNILRVVDERNVTLDPNVTIHLQNETKYL